MPPKKSGLKSAMKGNKHTAAATTGGGGGDGERKVSGGGRRATVNEKENNKNDDFLLGDDGGMEEWTGDDTPPPIATGDHPGGEGKKSQVGKRNRDDDSSSTKKESVKQGADKQRSLQPGWAIDEKWAGRWWKVARPSCVARVAIAMAEAAAMTALFMHYPRIVAMVCTGSSKERGGSGFARVLMLMQDTNEPKIALNCATRNADYFGMAGDLLHLSKSSLDKFLATHHKVKCHLVSHVSQRDWGFEYEYTVTVTLKPRSLKKDPTLKAANDFDTFFITAIRNNHLDVVDCLVGNLKLDLETPLKMALQHSRYVAMVKLLVNRGAGDRSQLLCVAVERCHLELLRWLLDEGGDANKVDGQGRRPIHQTCYPHQNYPNHPEVAKILVTHGADVNATNGGGWSPLHCAARWCAGDDVRMVELLLKHDAKPEATGPKGLRPIHSAVKSHRPAVIKVLLKQGKADVSATDDSGRGALHHTAIEGDCFAVKTVAVLVEHGADPNARDQSGDTPLHICGRELSRGYHDSRDAFRLESIRCIQALLAYGANAGALDADGQEPWALAEESAVRALLTEASEYAKSGWSPLQFATRYGITSAVNYWTAKGTAI